MDETNYYLEYVYNAMSIDTATGNDLDRLVALFGIIRNSSSYAMGFVTFSTGDEPYQYDIEIPYGYEVSTRQNSSGQISVFNVAEDNIILKAGQKEIDVLVKADTPGHRYLAANTLTVMGKSIVGIATVTNKDEINSGQDEETDEQLRKRAKEYVLSFGKCTKSAIETAVNKVTGIASCRVIDLYKGNGTIGIIVVPEVVPIPDDVASEVNKVIDETKAAGIKVFVIDLILKGIDLEIVTSEEIDPDKVLEAISNYANSLEVGQTFIISQMERKILNAVDDNDIENDSLDIKTITPNGNVPCVENEVIKVNTVKLNGVIYNV
ncbi:MAG: baseplate J/gp47 family protein [Ruminococcus flavefaciens]|nr:baseplate J/gp47 family protein [Ruminococcus flavefaciens]